MPVSKDNERTRRIPVGPREIAATALTVFGVIATAVTVIAIVESYSNLLAFALTHGLSGWRAALAPAAVDSFIIMGELLLFAALLLEWDAKSPFVIGGAMAVWGFALSVGGNVSHASIATAADRAVSAIWPVTATAGLAGGLIIAKRLIAGRRPANAYPAAPAGVPAQDALAGQAPPPAPVTPPRGPRHAVRAARAPELAAVRSDTELQLARELAATALPWPGEQKLAREDPRYGGSRRMATRVLALARTVSNGHGTGDDDGH